MGYVSYVHPGHGVDSAIIYPVVLVNSEIINNCRHIEEEPSSDFRSHTDSIGIGGRRIRRV